MEIGIHPLLKTARQLQNNGFLCCRPSEAPTWTTLPGTKLSPRGGIPLRFNDLIPFQHVVRIPPYQLELTTDHHVVGGAFDLHLDQVLTQTHRLHKRIGPIITDRTCSVSEFDDMLVICG
jgi:hypothetical protein